MKETPIRSLPGIPMLLALLAAIVLCAWMVISGVQIGAPLQVVAGIVLVKLWGFVGRLLRRV